MYEDRGGRRERDESSEIIRDESNEIIIKSDTYQPRIHSCNVHYYIEEKNRERRYRVACNLILWIITVLFLVD